jgi:CYTH domain-containing protein/CHAD domain-containing protein
VTPTSLLADPTAAPLPLSSFAPLLDTALTRSAHEGARIVALHWLHDLTVARQAWTLALDDAERAADVVTPEWSASEALHRARVAVRRLRATLREHQKSLGVNVDRRSRRVLRRIGNATNVIRDRDAQREWLDVERHALTDAARVEADAMLEALEHEAGDGRALVTRVFARKLDPRVAVMVERLSHFAMPYTVGQSGVRVTFAQHLADRVERGAQVLQRDLGSVTGVDAQDVLHRCRIRLKRQRAMLAPFARVHPAIGEWYALATSGQDMLGAMRDTTLLAELASARDFGALAAALHSIALGHYEAFHHDWCDGHERVANAARAAVHALHEIGAGATAASASDTPPEGHLSGARYDDGIPTSLRAVMPMEIERKFLLHGLPPVAAMAPSVRIDQGWLPGEQLRERLRRTTTSDGHSLCTRTVKLGPMGARIEIEEAADATLFDALWPLTAHARIRKRRHVIRDGELTWEVDVFLDRDLVLAEVELTSETQSAPLPDWLAPFVVAEVTHDPAYLNSVMAQQDVAAPDNVAH